MKVHADLDKCDGYANCIVAAPNVFSIDDADDVVIVLDEQPPEEQRDQVEEAVRNCPVAALAFEER